MLKLIPSLALALMLAPMSVFAQNVTEWSSEQRTQLSFVVNPTTLAGLLPAGWVSVPSTSPATPGVNLNLTLMERVNVTDPQGKPLRTGTSRYFVLGVPARNSATGQTNTIIIGGMSPEGAGAYGVYVTASTATVERTVKGDGEAFARVEEHWQFAAASGEKVDLALTYRRGPATRAKVESVVRSGRTPEFQRTYRIDQATDVVRSANTPDRVERLSFTATGGAFSKVFDGTQALVGVTAIPYYVRDISVP